MLPEPTLLQRRHRVLGSASPLLPFQRSSGESLGKEVEMVKVSVEP